MFSIIDLVKANWNQTHIFETALKPPENSQNCTRFSYVQVVVKRMRGNVTIIQIIDVSESVATYSS